MTVPRPFPKATDDNQPAQLDDVTNLVMRAYSDKDIYHQKNVAANRRGDCKENVERLLHFLEVSGIDLASFYVLYFAPYGDEDDWDPRLAVDKEALRNEERAFDLRQVIMGKYRVRRALWKLHFALVDTRWRVFDVSARQDLLGVDFQPYFETMFAIEPKRDRQQLFQNTRLYLCAAPIYLRQVVAAPDEVLESFFRLNIETILNRTPPPSRINDPESV